LLLRPIGSEEVFAPNQGGQMANSPVTVGGTHRLELNVHGHGRSSGRASQNTAAAFAGSGMILGTGNDTIALPTKEVRHPTGVSGKDSVHLSWHRAAGSAASIFGGNAILKATSFTSPRLESASSRAGQKENAIIGRSTLLGGAASKSFVAAKTASFQAKLPDSTDHGAMFKRQGANFFQYLKGQRGSEHLIKDFVSGHDKVHLQAHTLASIKSSSDSSISSHGGNTYISLDGGKTTIELHGVAHMKATHFTQNRH
jgi:hypothetical protein